MSNILFPERDLYAGHTEDFVWTAELYENDNVTRAKLGVGDIVHFRLSERLGGEPISPVLAINSVGPTSQGSLVVIQDLGDALAPRDASGYVRFAQADTAAIVAAWPATLKSKKYIGELFYLDDSETSPADARKLICRGIVHLHRSSV
jgi:hypothetical protein